MHFSDTFKRLCKEKGITQKRALEDMCMGRNAVQKWTLGNPSADALQKIANYFGVSVDSLLASNPSSSISNTKDSVIVHGSQGNINAVNGSAQIGGHHLTEQELEVLRIFRSLDMRKKTAALSYLYELEDSDKN